MRKKTCLKILEFSNLSSLWRNQNEIFSPTKTLKIFIWPGLDNHCWPRFDSQDWFSGSPTDFSSGCFCWTRDQKILSRELKNSRIFLNLQSFEKRGQQILAKVGRINIMRQYPDKIRLCLKKSILKKYWPKHFNLLLELFKRDYDGMKKEKNRSIISSQKVSQA